MTSLEKAKESMSRIVDYLRYEESVPPQILVPAFDVQKYLDGIDESNIPKKVDVSELRSIKFSVQHYALLKDIFKDEPDKINELEEAHRSQNKTLLDVLYSTELIIHRRAGRCFENILNPEYMASMQSVTKNLRDLSFLE